MACGTDDLSEILKVLKINHEENNVDKECLRSLVDMYSGQDHRVELVLEELEQLLGKKMQRSNKDLKQGSSKEEDQVTYNQMLASDYFNKLVEVLPKINSRYAAFKAAEIAVMHNDFDQFLHNCVTNSLYPSSADSFVAHPDEYQNSDHAVVSTSIYEGFIQDQIQFVIRSVPDVDPDYVSNRVKDLRGDQEGVRNFVGELLEVGIYPKIDEYVKRHQYDDLANKLFTVEEFLELFDDPLTYFYDENSVTSVDYRRQAINKLRIDFRHIGASEISRTFRSHNYHYAPTNSELKNRPDHASKLRPNKESFQVLYKDILFTLELAFVRIEDEIRHYVDAKKALRNEIIDCARRAGTLMECPICCDDELVQEDFVTCRDGHRICFSCVRRHCEELFSVATIHITCPSVSCTAEYSLTDLKLALKSSVYNILVKRRQAEEVLKAGIPGLESCPFCDYCEVLPEGEKVFQCRNPECGKMSCRRCREMNHAPLRCAESSMETRLRTYVEERMTRALLRTCPNCQKTFMKAEGCNKMTCVCGAVMCYVCRQSIRGYDHFSRGQCPLWSDIPRLHERDVADGEALARQEILNNNLQDLK